jgi:hypothetical protein
MNRREVVRGLHRSGHSPVFPCRAVVSRTQPCELVEPWRGTGPEEVPELKRLAVMERGLEDAVQCTCRARLQVGCVAWW